MSRGRARTKGPMSIMRDGLGLPRITRARQAAAKAARSATSKPLAANSSANRRG